MSLSDYSEELMLDALLTEMPFFVAFSTEDPGDAGGSIAEPTGNSYARTESSDFARGDPGSVIANTASVVSPTASGSWGEITHFAIFDAAESGNFLGSGELDTPQTVVSGEALQANIGDLTITLD